VSCLRSSFTRQSTEPRASASGPLPGNRGSVPGGQGISETRNSGPGLSPQIATRPSRFVAKSRVQALSGSAADGESHSPSPERVRSFSASMAPEPNPINGQRLKHVLNEFVGRCNRGWPHSASGAGVPGPRQEIERPTRWI
jgi:hypothetical protein